MSETKEFFQTQEKRLRQTTDKAREPVRLYTIIRSGADADHGSFPSLTSEGSFFSRDRARGELARLAGEEKKNLSARYDKIDEGEDSWEAYEDGYAAAHFTRLEIVSSEFAGASCQISAEALPVVQFKEILSKYLPGCTYLSIAGWVYFAVEFVEEEQFVNCKSSGSSGRDIQEWLALICAAILNVRKVFGTEIALKICNLALLPACPLPWEMFPAAKRLKAGESLDSIIRKIESGEVGDINVPIPPLSDFLDFIKHEDLR